MQTQLARERAVQWDAFHAFISLTSGTDGNESVAVKDIIDVAGLPTTCGAPRPIRDPIDDAPLIARIRESGAVIVGKTNMHEWSCGITSDNRTYGAVLNPADVDRIPGGSSGGSAVAVALQLCDWALGSDTGGSIRIPAAFCGVVGFKPSTGVLPDDGVLGVSRTLDSLGPMARSVAEVGSAFAVLSDSAVPPGWETGPLAPFPVLRLGTPVAWADDDLDEITHAALQPLLESAVRIVMPPLSAFVTVQQTIVRFEAFRLHRQRLADSPDLFSPDVAEFLASGLAIDEPRYRSALAERADLAGRVDEAMDGIDALVLPTTSCVAPLRKSLDIDMDRVNRLTRPFNVTAQPAISLPVPGAALPVGLQLVGRRNRDWKLLSVAKIVEARLQQSTEPSRKSSQQ